MLLITWAMIASGWSIDVNDVCLFFLKIKTDRILENYIYTEIEIV